MHYDQTRSVEARALSRTRRQQRLLKAQGGLLVIERATGRRVAR